MKAWMIKARDKRRETRKRWEKSPSGQRQKALKCARMKERMVTDLNFRITEILRRRLREVLKIQRAYKTNSALKLLGCSLEELKTHIEKQFKPGMNWDNHRRFGWHIDHVRPCASFDMTDPIQQSECFGFRNLQPLWWWENIQKSAKFVA